jgi:hypothetical protein
MPWYGWAYLTLLCLIGAGGFVLETRAGRLRLALLRIAAILVLGYGVLLFFRGSGAGVAYALALLCAIAVLAQKSLADARTVQRGRLSPAARLGVALGEATLLPAAVLGALAFWMQRGG